MDHLELILAAEVRSLALIFQRSAMPDELRDSGTQEQKQQWWNDHPATAYVPMALQELKEVAKLIKTL